MVTKKISGILLTLAVAIIGAYVLRLLHAPIPWLLGPMLAVAIMPHKVKQRFIWPTQIRNTGMIVVGYTIGLSMTAAALKEMARQLPYMLLMTVLLLLLCGLIAFVMSKMAKTDYRTALLASVPGGMTQVLTLAEETKEINLMVVTVTQVIRLMIIIASVPFLIFSPIFGETHAAASYAELPAQASAWSGLTPSMIIYALVCIVCAIGGSRIKLPTAFLLGPVIGTAILHAAGLEAAALPPILLQAAQLMLGVYVGLMLKPEGMNGKVRILVLAILSGFLLMLGAWGLSGILTALESAISPSTSLLSLAPGGSDQMGLLAHEINADLSIVTGYQLFRTFFIMFAIPPLLRLLFKYVPAPIQEKGVAARPVD
ncbi:AbrB family transcriptional regulator [Paenibacillus sp. GCM10027626]|uniref:AbrB family transcriptional regulator n=1 Tax=Paenibacillus sp. GCM10027626 TaxID=3273411 RepID=UPI00362BCF25